MRAHFPEQRLVIEPSLKTKCGLTLISTLGFDYKIKSGKTGRLVSIGTSYIQCMYSKQAILNLQYSTVCMFMNELPSMH